MLSEERKEEIRLALVEMAKTRRHASAMLWIGELPIEEEEYARSIFGEVEQVAAGGPWNMSSMRVPVPRVWDKLETPEHRFRGYSSIRKALDVFQELKGYRPPILDPQLIQALHDRLNALIGYGPVRKQDDMLDSVTYADPGLSKYSNEQIVFHKGLDGKWVREPQGNTSKDGEAGE